MKSHVNLFTTVLHEAGLYCGVNTSADEKTVSRRLSKEGESFLTISLPAYEKDLLQALDRGQITSDLFTGFRRAGGFPLLFSGFLRIIFDSSGRIRDTSDSLVKAIRSLRQVLLFLSKIELDSSPARVKKVLDSYKVTDSELSFDPDNDMWAHDWVHVWGVRNAAKAAFGQFLDDVEQTLYEDAVFRGFHGPGAVADHTGNNARWSLNRWTERLEAVLPAESTLSCNLHDYMDQEYLWLSEDQEPPVRVVTVPKTMKGPRVIAIEPAHMQYVQQGLFSVMTEVLNRPAHSRLKSTMGWNDQEPNRALARDWQSYATVDLSEASDRVSFALVRHLFESWPLFWGAIEASRSLRAELPDGEIIHLRKFASMGSAMCFPIESMVFTAIAVYAKWMTEDDYLTTSYRSVAGSLSTPFRVFGDDIIVPRSWTPNLLEVLGLCGLKVNAHKSFWTGKFRESCGADWYDGFDVGVVKIRSTITPDKQDVPSIVRGISLHNRFMELGWLKSAEAVEDILKSVYPMPYAPYGTDVLALWTYDYSKVAFGRHEGYQCLTIRAFSLKYLYKRDELDGYGALRKYFAKIEKSHVSHWDYDILRLAANPTDAEHLLRAGRPVHVTMRARYVVVH